MTEQISAGPSPGEMLRTAREQQGLHIAALAAAIKVSPRKLEALEHDRWEELPDATFIRALAQAICKTLKIDAAPVLALLPRTPAVVLETVSPGLNAPFRERPAQDESGLNLGAIRPMVIAASVLLVAAVAVYLLPENLWSSIRSSTDTNVPVPVAEGAPASAPAGEALAAPMAVPTAAPTFSPTTVATVTQTTPPTTAPTRSPMATPTTPPSTALLPSAKSSTKPAPLAASSPSSAPAPLTAKPAASSSMAPLQLAAPKAPAPAPTASRPAPAPSAAANTGSSPMAASTLGTRPTAASSAARPSASSLRLRTSGPSWIEVLDADGKVLLSRVLEGGEAVNVDGAAPLQLTVGNAGDTQVEYRGRAVDLGPKTRNNVARVELK